VICRNGISQLPCTIHSRLNVNRRRLTGVDAPRNEFPHPDRFNEFRIDRICRSMRYERFIALKLFTSESNLAGDYLQNLPLGERARFTNTNYLTSRKFFSRHSRSRYAHFRNVKYLQFRFEIAIRSVGPNEPTRLK